MAQIRTQVNISQQQRIPTTNATRVSAQMLQVQAAQQRALNTSMTAGGPNISPPHLSPGFAQRAPVSSPVVSHSTPPRTSTTPNPPRPSSASQHQGHAQASPNLPHVTATRQNPAPGMYFPSLHGVGVQFTPEMEHAVRIQMMVSGGFHLYCRLDASTATTPFDDAELCPSGAGATSSSGAGAGAGSGSSPSTGTGTGTGRSTDRIVPASALNLTLFILHVNTISYCLVHLYHVDISYISYDGRMPHISKS